jgi:hypothetical protein
VHQVRCPSTGDLLPAAQRRHRYFASSAYAIVDAPARLIHRGADQRLLRGANYSP